MWLLSGRLFELETDERSPQRDRPFPSLPWSAERRGKGDSLSTAEALQAKAPPAGAEAELQSWSGRERRSSAAWKGGGRAEDANGLGELWATGGTVSLKAAPPQCSSCLPAGRGRCAPASRP